MQQPIIQSLNNSITLNASSLPPNIQQDLMQVFTTLQSSLYLMFLHYKPHVMQYENYFKLTALLFLVYLFYKLGGMTVTDRVESEKEKLRTFIERKNFVQEKVPKQINKINSNTIKLLLLSVILAAAYAYAFYTGHQQKFQQFQTPIIISAILIVCFIVYSNISKLILYKRLKQVSKLQQTYSQKLNQFATSLGPKVMAILRNHLCRQIQLKFSSSRSINDCQKQDCKQLRALLKQKNDAISTFVQQTVDFEWCSICKRRTPFDEHLHFQALPYEPLQTQNQGDEVKNKLGYLVEGLDRMRKWLSETSPCNCSKLYWTTSTKQSVEFKKTQIVIDAKIKQSQIKHKHQ